MPVCVEVGVVTPFLDEVEVVVVADGVVDVEVGELVDRVSL